eukprot:366203-Chlamydomonas_euryale.AAC.8
MAHNTWEESSYTHAMLELTQCMSTRCLSKGSPGWPCRTGLQCVSGPPLACCHVCGLALSRLAASPSRAAPKEENKMPCSHARSANAHAPGIVAASRCTESRWAHTTDVKVNRKTVWNLFAHALHQSARISSHCQFNYLDVRVIKARVGFKICLQLHHQFHVLLLHVHLLIRRRFIRSVRVVAFRRRGFVDLLHLLGVTVHHADGVVVGSWFNA